MLQLKESLFLKLLWEQAGEEGKKIAAACLGSGIMNSAVRQTIGSYRPDDLYSTARQELQDQMLVDAVEEMGRIPVLIQGFVVKSITLPEVLREAIERKLIAEQDYLRYKYILLEAQQEARRKTIEGEGIKAYQTLVNENMTRMLLVIIGTSQLLYACGTLVLFDTFVKQAVRTKADILAEGTGRDFEYLIHKGVDIASLRGKDQALEQLLAANSELAGAQLLTPEGKSVASAGHVPDPALTVEKSLSTYWPSRFRQKQEVLRLQLAVQPQAITTRISALALDLGASLLISFLLLLELSKLLGLIAQRNLPPDAAANVLGGSHHSLAVQALRAAGFVFFLGYDMVVSLIFSAPCADGKTRYTSSALHIIMVQSSICHILTFYLQEGILGG